jgi:hypothetical protein
MSDRILFARVGWMKWYRGPQADDEKPIGGGSYNKTGVGGENLNFVPINGKVCGYFQPQLQPKRRRKAHPSFVNLERIDPTAQGKSLDNVLVIFVATDPENGGQRVVGWYRNATIHRYAQQCNHKKRGSDVDYYAEAAEGDAFLVPASARSFVIPKEKGGFGQTNVRYPDPPTKWMLDAVGYVNGYRQENAAQQPETAVDPEIADLVASTVERAAGFQSNPRIRRAIEDYAMNRAMKWLAENGFNPRDKHKNNPYDILCAAAGADLYVEVKGTQDAGTAISLTPREVEHVRKHRNSALFIVHSVKVKGKRSPEVSAGEELFIEQWDISAGKLEPRGYTFHLPASTFAMKRAKKEP